MFFHYFFNVVQADAKSFYIVEVSFRHSVKLLKNMFCLLWAQAAPIVFDLNLRSCTLRQTKFNAIPAILDGIVQEVGNHLLKMKRVYFDRAAKRGEE